MAMMWSCEVREDHNNPAAHAALRGGYVFNGILEGADGKYLMYSARKAWDLAVEKATASQKKAKKAKKGVAEKGHVTELVDALVECVEVSTCMVDDF